MSSATTLFSQQMLERFVREVAKYPPERKDSAVMACLAIVQQEQGFISCRKLKQAEN